MMNKLREKDGSVIMGALLIFALLIPFFVFSYETATLLILKEKSQNIADNIASSAILEVDMDLLKSNDLKINKSKAINTANRIFEESYKNITSKSIYLNKPELEIFVLNNPGESCSVLGQTIYYEENPSVVIYTELSFKNDMIFYKDIKVRSVSRGRVNSTIDDHIDHLGCIGGILLRLIPSKYLYNRFLEFENR